MARDKGLTQAQASSFAPKTEMVQLPSQVGTGEAVELKRPNLVSIIRNGEAPDVLTNLMMSNINGGTGGMNIEASDMPQLMEMLETLAAACFINPVVVLDEALADPDKGVVYVGWLDFGDLTFVFGWALGGDYQPVSSFRGEPSGNVEAVPTDESV